MSIDGKLVLSLLANSTARYVPPSIYTVDPQSAWLLEEANAELAPARLLIQILINTERIIELLERKGEPSNERITDF